MKLYLMLDSKDTEFQMQRKVSKTGFETKSFETKINQKAMAHIKLHEGRTFINYHIENNTGQ